MTIQEAIEQQKVRKGKANGTTKRGAYWLAADILIRREGGDGIGQSAADIEYRLELRHYRSGEIRSVIRRHTWHQNSGGDNSYRSIDLGSCATVEAVVVALKREQEPCYSDGRYQDLCQALIALGLPESEPAPDGGDDAP